MARPTLHEQEDDALGRRPVMRAFQGQIGFVGSNAHLLHERSQHQRSKPGARLLKHIAAIQIAAASRIGIESLHNDRQLFHV